MDVEQRARKELMKDTRSILTVPTSNERMIADDAVKTVCRLIERHDAFKREVSDAVKGFHAAYAPYRAISFLAFDTYLSRFILPDPVEPLLIEARELCAKVVEDLADANGLKASEEHWRHKYLTGDCDRNKDVQAIFAALKRGLTITKEPNQ